MRQPRSLFVSLLLATHAHFVDACDCDCVCVSVCYKIRLWYLFHCGDAHTLFDEEDGNKFLIFFLTCVTDTKHYKMVDCCPERWFDFIPYRLRFYFFLFWMYYNSYKFIIQNNILVLFFSYVFLFDWFIDDSEFCFMSYWPTDLNI